jgi:hypothetical protein
VATSDCEICGGGCCGRKAQHSDAAAFL